MKLSRAVREKIVNAVVSRLQMLFDNYEEVGTGVTYFTMLREDGTEGFGCMMTLDPARTAALKMQMLVDEALSGGFEDKSTSIEFLPDDTPPEQN